ncbi:MAG: AarF/ABC1/UbiB kinase family protein [Nevskiaceae bacterium]|nr:MAG: AarF/ABC1/UbiB kinase family protein [Nevskiaceae bacterium]TBR74031.1 MAG: AarF/ABC1/UbiB kinase family protein [Nevskiaceae bacterium]
MPIRVTHASGRAARLLGASARTLGRSLLKHVPGGDRIEKQAQYWAEVGEDWANTLGELRGAAMKMGQMIAQYSDLFPKEFTDKLKKLQRNVEPLPFEEVSPLLDAAWSPAQRALVAHVEPRAIAAASIGQVHRAQLADGTPIVIKLRYPGVHEAVTSDVKQLRRILGLSKLLPIEDTAMDRLVAEVKARFEEETDFGNELRNLLELRGQPHRGIVYPKPLAKLCGPGVLVMSEESGAAMEEAQGWDQGVRDQLGSHLLAWLCRGIYRTGTVHADPHAGNFAFRDNGDVVVYDFGCVKHIPPQTIDELKQLLNCGLAADWPGTHAAMERLGGIAHGVSANQLEAFYAELADRLYVPVRAQDGFDFSDTSYVAELRACVHGHLGDSFKFRPISELLFVTRAISGVYWLLRNLEARVPVARVLAANGAPIPS